MDLIPATAALAQLELQIPTFGTLMNSVLNAAEDWFGENDKNTGRTIIAGSLFFENRLRPQHLSPIFLAHTKFCQAAERNR